ncbi:MAG: ABC transporter permease [Spirochaetales bacterium]|nr:ABC transporter permease [Spirochaetales bacterium]
MRRSARAGRTGQILGLPEYLVKLITLVLLIGGWELLSRAGLLSPLRFPRPSALLATLWDLMTEGYPRGITVWIHIKATVIRILQGYALAALVGIPVGLMIGRSRWLQRAANPVVTFARSIAVISLLPLAIAWFGVGELTRVLLIAWGCFWAILTNTIQGASQVDRNYLNAGRMLGASRRQLFFRVILPAALPRIFAGMKIALGVGFMIIVAVEMVGTIQGLGALIQQARFYYSSKVAIDGMIVIGVFGLLISVGLDLLERVILPWAVGLEEVER